MEAARDGLGYDAVEQHGYEILEPERRPRGRPELVGRIELEALFADGYRLMVLTTRSPLTLAVARRRVPAAGMATRAGAADDHEQG